MTTICQCPGCKQMTVSGQCLQCHGIVLDFGLPFAADTRYMAWPAEVLLPTQEQERARQAAERCHEQ